MKGIVAFIATTFLASVIFTSCDDEKHYYVKNVGDGEHTPTMSTINVNTFISDSGYTKYYIKTPLWDMYEEAQEPYWYFPKGVELEQYDNKQKTEANLRCDTAKYLSQRRIWQLDGRVVMVNVYRDTFLTNQVFWDQSTRKIYSDSFVHIVKTDRVIEGYGFESNENMTEYIVKRPTGIFPVPKKSDSAPSSGNNNVTTESEYDEDMHMAPAPRRASERNALMRSTGSPYMP